MQMVNKNIQRRIAESLAVLTIRLHTVCHGMQQCLTDVVLKRNGNFFLTATIHERVAYLGVAAGPK